MFRQWDIIPFLSVHAMCLWAFQTGIKPEWLLLAIGSYYLRMVGVTAGYHRYFAHRSYKTSRVFQFLLAFLAMTSAQKGVSGGPPTTGTITNIQTGKKTSIRPCSGDSGSPMSGGPCPKSICGGLEPHQRLRPIS
jgi:Fatty-acid desaturase